MHKIENTPKIVTIIGLVLEGFGAVMLTLMAVLFSLLEEIPGMSESIAEMPPEELEAYEFFMGILLVFLIVMAVIITTMFIVNLVLFTKLIKGEFTEAQARKVYLYQAIYGGINIIFNTVVGILYLVSGIQGYSGQPDRIDTREGI